MNIFKKIFGNKANNKPETDYSKFVTVKKTGYKSIQELLELNVGISSEKQLIFGDIIGSNPWNLDLNKGSIKFGELEFPIQIIGSFSFGNSSWMWGWANSQSGFTENLLIQSNKLKEFGVKNNIKDLIEGHFTVEKGFEHKIGLIASGLFNSKSYYCANYGKGTLVVTMDDDKIPDIDKNRLEKVLISFPQLISGINLNHKNAFKNYLIDREIKLKISENKIEGLRNNEILIAEFDEFDRLKSLKADL